MVFLQEKQARNHVLYCIGVLAVFLALITGFGFYQGYKIKEVLFYQEQAIVSSLLEQGVETETIAAALNNRNKTAAGRELLQNIGHTMETKSWMFPYVWQTTTEMTRQLLVIFLLEGIVFLVGTLYYLNRRETVYQNAIRTIHAYTEGNFGQRLSCNHQAGTIYRLFASVDELASSLQSKSENEHKMKEFMKNIISDISHQLKTPLAALYMYMEIIREDAGKKDIVLEFARKSTASLDRMEELIASLLKIMRLDAGNIIFTKRENQISELLRQSISELLMRAEQEKKSLHLKGNEGDLIWCDSEWTIEALGNLVKNALDHTKTGGNVWIEWVRSPLMVRVTIRDDGCGIAPEDIHHIFKRFYRSKYSNDKQGAGLGLPLAKAIIEGQGGLLTVSSNPGEGASFFISFLTEA